MSKLPSSWKLKTKKRTDGKLDIVGKDDLGKEYKVRTTQGSEVTDDDVREIRECDREAYTDRYTGAKTFVNNLISEQQARERAKEAQFGLDIDEAAGPVSFALLDRKGHSSPFTGSTQAYRE